MSDNERKDESVSTEVQERRRRSDAGEVRGTARDVELLPWVVEMDGMPVDLLARLAATSEGAVRNLLARWRRAGWVESGRVDAGPAWCWATREGVARFGRADYAVRPPSTARAAHTRAVIEARMQIERNRPGVSWTSERELRAGVGVGQKGHTADAVIGFPRDNGDVDLVAVEVELARKPADRIKRIMQELLTSYPSVMYLASTEVLPVLRRVQEQMGPKSGSVTIQELKR